MNTNIQKGKQENLSGYFRIEENEITYIEAEKDYYNIHLLGKKDVPPVKVHGTLGSAMIAFHGLVKPHKSYLVNMAQVYCVATDPDDNYAKLIFRDGTSVKFSKSKTMYMDFMQRLYAYADEK